MMTRDDLESYLLRLDVESEEVDDDMWVLHGAEEDAPVVVHYSPPVLLLRLKVMDLPPRAGDDRLAGFFRRLLELNASDILHGSYGIDGEDVILSDALALETMDFLELRNSYESVAFAASSHLPDLAQLVPVAEKD